MDLIVVITKEVNAQKSGLKELNVFEMIDCL